MESQAVSLPFSSTLAADARGSSGLAARRWLTSVPSTTASQRGAIAMSADCRLVVAKQRSERPGVHKPGNRSRVASSTPSQSRCDSVVWARRLVASRKFATWMSPA